MEMVETFSIGNTIKVKCHMVYDHEEFCIFLKAQTLEEVCSVKVVVK